jgi:hypothetical protein
MIETELEKPILSRIEWVEMPVSIDLAVGYMIGLLEEKAIKLSLHSEYRWTPEQIEKYDQATRKMIRNKITQIVNKIRMEKQK